MTTDSQERVDTQCAGSQPPTPGPPPAAIPWMRDLRALVDERLIQFFADKRREAKAVSERSLELVEAVADLTMRGGKRLRPVVLACGYRASCARASLEPTVEASAALELLQSYLLIHDDWMDQDETRRGGPSVFAAMRDRYHDGHLGGALAILAGDLASAYASELITGLDLPPSTREGAIALFWRMQHEVFFGQQLDLLATDSVEPMYDLKTGSYTVRGPLQLGGLIAGATLAQQDALKRFGTPLGIAFQLRDELLGTFGHPDITGKPRGSDLRAGKHTALVAHARRLLSNAEREPLEHVLGQREASDRAVSAATELLIRSGAKDHVEARVAALVSEARQVLHEAPLERERLEPLTEMLAQRDH